MSEPKPVRGILCRHTAGWTKTDVDGTPVESVSRCVVCNRHATREDIEQWKQRSSEMRLRMLIDQIARKKTMGLM